MRASVGSRLVVGIFLLALVLVTLQDGALAQTSSGATLTVLRGTAAVRKADGTPLSRAPSGMTIGVGDQVATLANASALITFFDGSELELGADTALIVQEMAGQGGRTTITVQSVFGATIHRVVTLTDPSSSYRVEAGGTVALVRGTTFAHYNDPSTGDVTVAVSVGRVNFPTASQTVNAGESSTSTSRGDVQTGSFSPGTPLFQVVTNPVTQSSPSGGQNPGQTTGNLGVPEHQNRGAVGDDSEPQPPPAPPSRSLTPGPPGP